MRYRDEDGRLRRLVGVSWDVTGQVHQEERRLELQLQLQEASRNAGMAEIATGVLHSVGNVLNSLGVSAALLQARTGRPRRRSRNQDIRIRESSEPAEGLGCV